MCTCMQIMIMEKKDIRKLNKTDLLAWLKEQKEPSFRADQISEWLWKQSARSFDEMTNLSKSLRGKLATHFTINAITLDVKQKSNDGTIKFRFKLYDGHAIESVLIPVPSDDRYTVCVSSQVGCSLSCSFCATGRMERKRNLDAGEIYDQVVMVGAACEEIYDHPITNVVYMGMGEPLLAYKPVIESIRLLTNEDYINMASRRFTISTAGIAKMIMKLADDESKVNLALSLHAADDKKRSEIMPINNTNTLEKLMDSLKYYYEKTKNRISYEYIAFNNFNDSIEDAKKLAELCKHFPVRINIIEYNPIGGDFMMEKSEHDRLDKFASYLQKRGVTVTIRRSRGKDIDAACGQLANKG